MLLGKTNTKETYRIGKPQQAVSTTSPSCAPLLLTSCSESSLQPELFVDEISGICNWMKLSSTSIHSGP